MLQKKRCAAHPVYVLGVAILVGCVLLLLATCNSGPGSAPKEKETPPPDDGGQKPEPEAPESPPSWHEVLSENAIPQAIYAIGFSLSDGRNYIVGTGFAAYYKNAIWTNAHVAIGLRDDLNAVRSANPSLKPVPFAVKNGTRIGGADTHLLRYYDVHSHYDGTARSPDVALVVIERGSLSGSSLSFLPREHATGLQIGEPVATMGFPGELGNPYRTVPVATFKDGVISAFRPYSDSEPQVTPANGKMVQHNLDLSPGTSGSPIIDRYGWVIAVNNAGTSALGIDIRTGEPTRIPSGNIGFGIRVDDVWAFIDEIDARPRSGALSNQAAGVEGALRLWRAPERVPSPEVTP